MPHCESKFLLLPETLKKTHSSPYLVVFSVWCVHVTFHWVVCVCMRSVTVGFFGRGFMSFGVCVCVTTVLFLGSFWETFLCLRPPSTFPWYTRQYPGCKNVSLSLPHGKREKPFRGMFKSLGEATQEGTRSSSSLHQIRAHQKGSFFPTKFLLIFFFFLWGPPSIFYCSVSSGGPVGFKREVYIRKVYFFLFQRGSVYITCHV